MNVKEGTRIEGFSRVRIRDGDGKIVGDSGWCGPNQIVNYGFRYYLCALLANTTGSKQVKYVSLGEGTAPASNATSLESECSGTNNVPLRKAVAAASSGSTTEEFTATLGSSDSFVTATESIANIGLFFATTSNDTLFAGNTYTSSSCASNQDVKRRHLSVMIKSNLLKFRETLEYIKTILSQALNWEGATTIWVAPAFAG